MLADQRGRKQHPGWWSEEIGQYSPTTIKRYLASLSKLFSCAVNWGRSDSNPVKLIEKPKEPSGRVRYLSHVGEQYTANILQRMTRKYLVDGE